MSDEEYGQSEYVSPQERFEPRSTKWYATAPIIKYLYQYVMFGCTRKNVMNELVLKEEEVYDDEGGEKSVKKDEPHNALTFFLF